MRTPWGWWRHRQWQKRPKWAVSGVHFDGPVNVTNFTDEQRKFMLHPEGGKGFVLYSGDAETHYYGDWGGATETDSGTFTVD